MRKCLGVPMAWCSHCSSLFCTGQTVFVQLLGIAACRWIKCRNLCRAMRETAELKLTPISVDIFDAQVACQAVAAEAHMVNDV